MRPLSDFLQHNAFSELHNTIVQGPSGPVRIVFCKHEYLSWPDISKMGPIILISGNSDAVPCVDNPPSNVLHWFCGNLLVKTPRATCIPIGLENAVPCARPDHGVVWPRASNRIEILKRLEPMSPKSFVLANFSIGTNPSFRQRIADLCRANASIDWFDTLDMETFLRKIPDYEAVVCPDGNGPDTHRVWEVLYAKRIALVFSQNLYSTLYKDYPVALLKPNDLLDETLLRAKIDDAKRRSFDNLYMDVWKQRIRMSAEEYKLRHISGPHAEYATHQPVLHHILSKTNGSILELGCGDSSTELISLFSKKYNRTAISIDSNPRFFQGYKDKYQTDKHSFVLTSDWDATLRTYANQTYDVVFIDHGSWESRAYAFRLFRYKTKYLILHDCDYFPEHNLLGTCILPFQDQNERGLRDYDSEVTHWREYFPKVFQYKTGPPTLLASMTEECADEINFEAESVAI
jgi:hypothetical protein